MNFRAYFKHMPTSMATYAYAEKKLGKQLEKYSLKVQEAHVTFWVEHDVYRVNCHIVADGGFADYFPSWLGMPVSAEGVLCSTQDEMRKEVRRQIKNRVDLVKIY